MAGNPLFGIILLAIVAGVILFRLYGVLGKRTGNERPPRDNYRLGNLGQQTAPSADHPAAPASNVVALPDRSREKADNAATALSDEVSKGLAAIKLADSKFDVEHFLSGARGAYELIVTAFGAGDHSALKPLLSDEVYNAFDTVIRGREERGEKVAFTFVGFTGVSIVHAEMKAQTAEITVLFGSKYISTTVNSEGATIEGDSKTVREVTDNWTFARQTDAQDPNWVLVATSGGAES